MKTIIMVLALATVTIGQTTAPTTQEQSASELRKINRDLAAQVTDLKKQNESLRQRLADAIGKSETLEKKLDAMNQPEDKKIADAIKNEKLVVGMTIDQANKSLKVNGTMFSESDGSQYYQWEFVNFAYFAVVENDKIVEWQTGNRLRGENRASTLEKVKPKAEK